MDVFFHNEELTWTNSGSYQVTFTPPTFDPSTIINGKRYILTNCNFGQFFRVGANPVSAGAAIKVRVHGLATTPTVYSPETFQLYVSVDGVQYDLLADAARDAFPIPATALVTNSSGVSPEVSSMLDTFFINMLERPPPSPTNVRVKIDLSGCTVSWDSPYPCGLTFSNPEVSDYVLATSSPYHFIPGVGKSSVAVSALFEGKVSVATPAGSFFFFQPPETPTLSAAFVDGGIRVEWSTVNFKGVNVEYTLLRLPSTPLSVVGQVYTDMAVTPGQSYRYVLQPILKDPNGFLDLSQPSSISTLARAPIQAYLPLWNTHISKASAKAILYVSLEEMIDAFEVDPVNQIYYFKVERMLTILALNPAFAVVTGEEPEVRNAYQRMAENDYLRFLALQLWGNEALTFLFTNVPEVLVDIQTQCAAAMLNVRSMLESIDVNAATPAPSMVRGAKGMGFLATDPSPMNIGGIFMDNLQANGRFDGDLTNLPFIDGDAFIFEVNFQQTGFISRPYYIHFIMKEVVPPQPSTDVKAFLNWI